MSELKFKFKMPDDESLAEYISVKGEKGEKGDPTKLSQLDNDTNFVSKNTTELENYYTKAQTDSAIDADVSALNAELGVPEGFFTDTSKTVSGEGQTIALSHTANAVIKNIRIYGDTEQDGTPTTSSPLVIKVVSGEQTVAINNGTDSQSYEIDLGKNLYNKNAVTSGYYIDYTGEEISNGGFAITEYIEVQPNATYAYSGSTNQAAYGAKAAWYTMDKEWISSVGYNNSGALTAPSNAFFLRFSVRNADADTLQIEKGSTPSRHTQYFEPIELCKIGDYRDYIYKSGDTWYKHKEIGKVYLNELTWANEASAHARRYRARDLRGIIAPATTTTDVVALCSHYEIITARENWNEMTGFAADQNGDCFIYDDRYNTSSDLSNIQAWLDATEPRLYYALAESTEEEITEPALIKQLEILALANSYNGSTTITASGDLSMALWVECYKQNWDGTISGINRGLAAKANAIAFEDYYDKEEINSYLNVMLNGAEGDGVTDDTDAIQSLIDNNPNRTLYFPDGTYKISSSLITWANDAKKVYFKLSENAIIKASDDFTDDFLIEIGGKGDPTAYDLTRKKTGIDGGILDCNGRCGGLRIVNTHIAKVLNLYINNVLSTGLQIDQSNNASSDTYVKNIDIYGTNAQRDDAIGVVINGSDNNLEMVRTCGLHIGIQINGGGNWLISCHPLYGDSTEYYEQSIGFEINGGDTHLTDCYSDNFSIGFQVDDNRYFEARGLFCFWYSNDNYNHIALKVKASYLLGRIEGFKINFPTNGTNRGMVIESGSATRIYPDASFTNGDLVSGVITNLAIDDYQYMTYGLSDPILLAGLNGQKTQLLRGAADNIELNKWYPIAVFAQSGTMQLNIHIGGNLILNVMLNVNTNAIYWHKIQVERNQDRVNFKLGVSKVTELGDVFILYYKVTDRGFNTSADWVTRATVQSSSFTNRMILLPRTSVYTNDILKGIETLTNQVGETAELLNQNSGEGIFNTTSWLYSHEISLKNINANGQRPILLFIQTGSSTGIYGVFYGKIMPINTDNIVSGAITSMTITDDVLTVTTSNSSMISYCQL